MPQKKHKLRRVRSRDTTVATTTSTTATTSQTTTGTGVSKYDRSWWKSWSWSQRWRDRIWAMAFLCLILWINPSPHFDYDNGYYISSSSWSSYDGVPSGSESTTNSTTPEEISTTTATDVGSDQNDATITTSPGEADGDKKKTTTQKILHQKWPYIHDPTIVRNAFTEEQIKLNRFHRIHSNTSGSTSMRDAICAPFGHGPGEFGEEALARNLFSNHIKVTPTSADDSSTDDHSPPIRLFCSVYTMPLNDLQAEAVRQTWGRRCDGFVAASIVNNETTATIDMPHYGDRSKGKYRSIWQRVRSTLQYIYDNFIDDFSHYFLCGDDTYLIVENLKSYLQSDEFLSQRRNMARQVVLPTPVKDDSDIPALIGEWVHPFWLETSRRNTMNGMNFSSSFHFVSGGPGYVLSRNTVKLLVENVFPICHSETIAAEEDVLMAHCLQTHLNLTGYDTRDSMGRKRMFPFNVMNLARVNRGHFPRNDPELLPMHKFRVSQDRWLQQHHGWVPKYGIESVSPTAISFHHVKPAGMMYRYDRMFYRLDRSDDECK